MQGNEDSKLLIEQYSPLPNTASLFLTIKMGLWQLGHGNGCSTTVIAHMLGLQMVPGTIVASLAKWSQVAGDWRDICLSHWRATANKNKPY